MALAPVGGRRRIGGSSCRSTPAASVERLLGLRLGTPIHKVDGHFALACLLRGLQEARGVSQVGASELGDGEAQRGEARRGEGQPLTLDGDGAGLREGHLGAVREEGHGHPLADLDPAGERVGLHARGAVDLG